MKSPSARTRAGLVLAASRSSRPPSSPRARSGRRRDSRRRAVGGHGRRAHVPRHDGLGRPGVRHATSTRTRRRACRAAHFVQGRVLRAALIATAAGGGQPVSVARPELEVEQRQQDADAELAQERQVVGRQAADRGRRRLQPHGRQAGQGRWTCIGLDRRGHEHRLGQGRRARTASSIKLKTPDSQFIAAT